MNTQMIDDLLSIEQFRKWIGEQEVGKVGFTCDPWNCPLSYYLTDSLGLRGIANVEVSDDYIHAFDDSHAHRRLNAYDWAHHFVLAIDEIDSTIEKKAVSHEQALACLETAEKQAKEWAEGDLMECATCGKRISYREASHTMEPDTGAFTYYCADCDGFLYEPF
jgi:hypothetical protein